MLFAGPPFLLSPFLSALYQRLTELRILIHAIPLQFLKVLYDLVQISSSDLVKMGGLISFPPKADGRVFANLV